MARSARKCGASGTSEDAKPPSQKTGHTGQVAPTGTHGKFKRLKRVTPEVHPFGKAIRRVVIVSLGVAIAYVVGLLGIFHAGDDLGCCMADCCRDSTQFTVAALRSVGMVYRADNAGACPTADKLVDQRYIQPGSWQDDYAFHCEGDTVVVKGPPEKPKPPTPKQTWCPVVEGALTIWLVPFRS